MVSLYQAKLLSNEEIQNYAGDDDEDEEMADADDEDDEDDLDECV